MSHEVTDMDSCDYITLSQWCTMLYHHTMSHHRASPCCITIALYLIMLYPACCSSSSCCTHHVTPWCTCLLSHCATTAQCHGCPIVPLLHNVLVVLCIHHETLQNYVCCPMYLPCWSLGQRTICAPKTQQCLFLTAYRRCRRLCLLLFLTVTC